jgi:DNA-binding MarR family transcriptional regulator
MMGTSHIQRTLGKDRIKANMADQTSHLIEAAFSGADGDPEIRQAQDLLFFAYRDFTNAADVILEELGLGRAHHRAMHFIGRHPGITVSELLSILRITKQSLARVLSDIVERGYVAQSPGLDDRRQRLLRLTTDGEQLERRLFGAQKACLAEAFHAANPDALAGFREVMLGIMDESARAWVDLGRRGPRDREDRRD